MSFLYAASDPEILSSMDRYIQRCADWFSCVDTHIRKTLGLSAISSWTLRGPGAILKVHHVLRLPKSFDCEDDVIKSIKRQLYINSDMWKIRLDWSKAHGKTGPVMVELTPNPRSPRGRELMTWLARTGLPSYQQTLPNLKMLKNLWGANYYYAPTYSRIADFLLCMWPVNLDRMLPDPRILRTDKNKLQEFLKADKNGWWAARPEDFALSKSDMVNDFLPIDAFESWAQRRRDYSDGKAS